jgi:hypothetical protein
MSMTIPGQGGRVSRVERVVQVDHVSLEIEKSFDAFTAALERIVPRLDLAYAAKLEGGQASRARDTLEQGPSLSIFVTRNHGALLPMWGGSARNAVQYEIGNPLTASSMTRRQQLERPAGVALALVGLAQVAASEGAARRAGQFFGSGRALLPTGDSLPVFIVPYDLDITKVRSRAGDGAAFDTGVTEGQTWSLSEAVRAGLADTTGDP